MKPPSDLTDAELDEAVARECFGVQPPRVTRVLSQGEIVAMEPDEAYMAPYRVFTPTTDARDAERVWDWLLTETPEVAIARDQKSARTTWHGSNCLEAVPFRGYLEPIRNINWKRALCEAALQVARREK